MNLVQRLQPRYIALVAALGSLIFIIAILAPQRFDLAVLVNAGTVLSDATAVPPGLTVIRAGDGYDGQFSYRLALDPFTNERSAEGMSLDLPPYRQQRILYPFLGWLASLGRSTLPSAALAGINVVAFTALAWLAGHFARLHGRNPLWGLATVVLPASFIALANDLGEIVLATCLLAAAVALERRSSLATTLALSLAVLAHEHGLIPVLAVALATLSVHELRTRGWWLTWLIPLVIFMALQAQLLVVWGEAPIRIAIGYLNGPFRGMALITRHLLPPGTVADALQLGGFSFLVMFSLVCLRALRTTSAHRALCLGWLFASVILFLGTGMVYEAELAFWRAAVVPLTLGSLVLLASRARLASPLLLIGAAFGLTMAVRLVLTAWHG